MNAASQQLADLRNIHLPQLERRIAFLLVGFKLALHLALSWRYGYFRDELYYFDCARHLSFGYADHAPLVAVYAKLALMLGGSLVVLRSLAAIAGALMVWLVLLVTRELGGGRYAQLLAGIVTIAAPAFLVMDSLMTMNAFEPVYWLVCVLMLARVLNGASEHAWIWFGVAAGVAIENKHSAVFFLIALFLAVLLSPARSVLRSKWPWIGVAIALLLALPNFIWQVVNRFPTYELLRNVATTHKNVDVSPAGLLLREVLLMGVIAVLVWGAGAVWAFSQRKWRFLGWTFVFFFAGMAALKAKDYYLFPIFPMMIAAGAVAWEKWAAHRRSVRVVIPAAVVLVSIVFSPIFLPILPPEKFVAYSRALHFAPPKEEVGHVGALPQYFGDQFGWESLTAEVARDYNALPAQERAHTGIFANNYGEAGALNFFGPRYGLPKAYSAHQSHWLWGPPPAPIGTKGTNLIVLQDTPESLQRLCAYPVQILSEHDDAWGMAEENGPILYCKGLTENVQDIWPELKHWN